MKQGRSFYLVVSLLIHTFWVFAFRPAPSILLQGSEDEPLEIDIVFELPPQAMSVSTGPRAEAPSQIPPAQSHLSLQSLVPSGALEVALMAGLGETHSDPVQRRTDNPGVPWGSGAAQLDRVSDFLLMEEVYRRIHNNIQYPEVFKSQGLVGTVNGRLVIGKGGHCLLDEVLVNSTNVYLKQYVRTKIKLACTRNFRYLLNRQRLNVDFSVLFTEQNSQYQPGLKKNNNIFGNVMFFYRSTSRPLRGSRSLDLNLGAGGPTRGNVGDQAVSIDLASVASRLTKGHSLKSYLEKLKKRELQLDQEIRRRQ